MPNPSGEIVFGWASREPVAALLLLAAAALLFAQTLDSRRVSGSGFMVWLQKLVHALGRAVVFLGVAGAFHFLLNADLQTFNALHGSFTTGGSLSNETWLDWRSSHGDGVIQSELDVYATVRREVLEAIPPADPSKPALYGNVIVEEPVSETSITAFDGLILMNLANPAHPTDGFNAFSLEADYRYVITNPVPEDVRIRFRFPLPPAGLTREVLVRVNGEETPVMVEAGALTWERTLEPGETAEAAIHYAMQGMDYFIYEIPVPRQIKDFRLSILMNTGASGLFTEPAEAVEMEVEEAGAGTRVTWKIGNAIIAPRIGLRLTQGWPYSPSHSLLVVLPYAGRALLFFLAMAAFTLLIAGWKVELPQMTILAALFCVPFLFLMAGFNSPGFVSARNWDLYQVRLLPVLSLVPLTAAVMLLRRTPFLPRVLILTLMVLFGGIYPWIGTLPDEQARNALLGGVQAAMVFYIFAFTLYVRVRRTARA